MPYIFRLNSEPEGVAVNLRADESWSPVISYDGGDVVESIPCALEASTDDDMAAAVQALHRIQENVRYYVNEPSSQHTQETWLEWSMLDESSTYAPRRRLVKALDAAFDSGQWFTCGEGNLAQELRMVLTLRCTGWWEGSVATGAITSATQALMTRINYTALAGTIDGDAPARMTRATLTGTGAGADDVFGAYIAFRSSKRHGTLANFVPVWELEDGTSWPLVGDSAIDTQAGASPGVANNCMTTDFATTTDFNPRIYISFNDVTANFSDNYGRYVVLYRGAVENTFVPTICPVRVDARPAEATIVTSAPSVPGVAFNVTNSATWRIYNTGLIVQLPPSKTHTGVDITEFYGFTIHAGRTQGTGDLYSDCLLLVPIDEYAVFYLWDPAGVTAISIPGGEYVRTGFYSGPDGSMAVLTDTTPSGYVLGVDTPYTEGQGIPPDDDVSMYFVTFNSMDGDNTYTDDTDITLYHYTRYHSLQGAT